MSTPHTCHKTPPRSFQEPVSQCFKCQEPVPQCHSPWEKTRPVNSTSLLLVTQQPWAVGDSMEKNVSQGQGAEAKTPQRETSWALCRQGSGEASEPESSCLWPSRPQGGCHPSSLLLTSSWGQVLLFLGLDTGQRKVWSRPQEPGFLSTLRPLWFRGHLFHRAALQPLGWRPRLRRPWLCRESVDVTARMVCAHVRLCF